MLHQDRRHFLQLLSAGALGRLVAAPISRALAAESAAASDDFFVFIHWSGGWDVTLWSDPRTTATSAIDPPSTEFVDTARLRLWQDAPLDGTTKTFEPIVRGNLRFGPGIGGLVASGLPSFLLVFSALALYFWVGTARIIRAQILQLRERDFIVSAEALGATPYRVIRYHLFPNVTFLIILQVSATLGGIAGSEIVLTWFGVGVQPPAASFGAMLFEGSGTRTFQTAPHLLLVPGAVVTLLLFAFNLLGDALNDAVRGR